MLSKIYSKQFLTILLMLMPCYALPSKGPKTHDPYNQHYVDWHSWAAYLYHHPGYKSYQPVTDIKKYGCHWGAWVTFAQKIEAIQARVGNITSPFELLRSKDFLVMYKHSYYYKKAFLDYIADKRYSLKQKEIAVYAMRESLFKAWEESYQLYKQKKIDLPLLELWLVITIVNDNCHFGYFERGRTERGDKQYVSLLQTIQDNLPKNSSLYKDIASVLLTKKLPKSWSKYAIHGFGHSATDYYTSCFPFYDILTDAVRDVDYTIDYYDQPPFGLDVPPYFLIAMEHPTDYYPAHFELGPKRVEQEYKGRRYTHGIDVLRYRGYTNEEKSMAIFGMSQLGVTAKYESSDYYAFMVEHAIEWYKLGNLSVHHLLELFICHFPTFYKYPFFILDYKQQAIQKALNKFIAEPTIPEGIKEVARKVKNGTLATKEEMDYMEGYRTFRATHFTLYETIVPHG